MKTKVIVLILTVLLAILNAGCFSSQSGKITGFRYIMSHALAKDTRRQNPAGKATPAGQAAPVNQETFTDKRKPVNKETCVSKEPPVLAPVKQDLPAARAKTVYLTFDDGPSNNETPMILDILDSYGVKGTFFVVGTSIERFPEVLKDAVRRGHAVGNHTYDHKYSEVYASNAAFIESIKKNEDLIFRIAGLRPKIVRDPGGQVRNDKALKDLLAQNGYTLVDWNIDSYDSRKPGLDGAHLVERVRRQAANPNIWSHMIILMHDGSGHINTVRALPTIIEMLKYEGFQFATLE